MTEQSAKTTRPNRMSRQKQRTRNSLINAAIKVIAEKGADAATINDITEAADVGFGSFYNYFSSKDEILLAALTELLERLGARIDGAVACSTDPLEALAGAIRLFVVILIAEPQWAKFLLRVTTIPGFNKAGLYSRLFRDIHKAEVAGRLHIVDSGAATHAVGGAILFLCIALQEGDLPMIDAPERVAGMAMRILGVDEKEIARLTALPRLTFERVMADC